MSHSGLRVWWQADFCQVRIFQTTEIRDWHFALLSCGEVEEAWPWLEKSQSERLLGPPEVPFYPFVGEGSPTKIDYRKKGSFPTPGLGHSLVADRTSTQRKTTNTNIWQNFVRIGLDIGLSLNPSSF